MHENAGQLGGGDRAGWGKMNYTYTVEENDGRKTIVLEGTIDHEDSQSLEELLDSFIVSGIKEFAVDFTQISFLPSICFGVLLCCGENAKAKGVRLLVKMNPHHAALARGIGMGQMVSFI